MRITCRDADDAGVALPSVTVNTPNPRDAGFGAVAVALCSGGFR